MTYEAIIKVDVAASNDEKVAAIRMGLHETAERLVSEHGQSADDVREWLDEAASYADDAEEDNRSIEDGGLQ